MNKHLKCYIKFVFTLLMMPLFFLLTLILMMATPFIYFPLVISGCSNPEPLVVSFFKFINKYWTQL